MGLRCEQFGDGRGGSGFAGLFRLQFNVFQTPYGEYGLFGGHFAPDAGSTGISAFFRYGDHCRQSRLEGFHPAPVQPADGGLSFLHFQFVCIGKQGHAQPLGQSRRDLPGIPVGGPLPGQHQIKRSQFAQRRRQDPSGGQGVGSGHPFIGQQDPLVRPHGDAFPEDVAGQGRPHGHQGHRAPFLVLQSQSRFQGVEIHRVQHGGSPHPDQIVVCSQLDIRNRRYLFEQYRYIHDAASFMRK